MKKKEIIIQGIKLNYYEAGSGEHLIFFHGGRLRALTFHKALIALSTKYHVIAPDIPGYGDSSTPTQLWTFKDYAKFFLLFFEKINIKKVTLVGYSMGGGIAYNLASISSNVNKLILIDSAGIEVATTNVLNGDIGRLIFYLTHPQYIITLLTLLKEYMIFISKHLMDINTINNIRKTCNDSSSYLTNIKIPTSIIWADEDIIFPIEIAKKLQKSIKTAKLFIVEGNHDWVLYKNDEFIKFMRSINLAN